MKQIVSYDFMRGAESRQADLCRNVLESMGADARFQPFAAELTVLKKAYEEWQKAAADAQNRDHLKVLQKNVKRKDCLTLMYKLAMQVNLLAAGDAEVGRASGFPLKAVPQKVTQIPPPHILAIKRLANPCHVELRWTKERGAVTHAIEHSLDGQLTWHNGEYSAGTKARLSGYEPGARVFFRVKAIGREVKSDWSPAEDIIMG